MSMHEVADNRARRRDLTCAATGLFAGGSLGTLTAVFVPVGGLILVAIWRRRGRCGQHGRRAPHQRRRLGSAIQRAHVRRHALPGRRRHQPVVTASPS